MDLLGFEKGKERQDQFNKKGLIGSTKAVNKLDFIYRRRID